MVHVLHTKATTHNAMPFNPSKRPLIYCAGLISSGKFAHELEYRPYVPVYDAVHQSVHPSMGHSSVKGSRRGAGVTGYQPPSFTRKGSSGCRSVCVLVQEPSSSQQGQTDSLSKYHGMWMYINVCILSGLCTSCKLLISLPSFTSLSLEWHTV